MEAKIAKKDKEMEQLLAEIRGALARGYCTKENEKKVLDPDLCNAQAQELLALIAADRAATNKSWQEKHFNDCMTAKKSGYEEGKTEASRDRAGLVEALEVGKDEIWRLRHASTERPERTLNVIKQMNQALKEVGK